ncbi:hypothetical protein CFP56_003080 [Quercus suber]|uniref:Uncharacterized protein n=1 Tax=Quercus suber TaxID=58331 RepID=A0AAW0IJD0_QUESU
MTQLDVEIPFFFSQPSFSVICLLSCAPSKKNLKISNLSIMTKPCICKCISSQVIYTSCCTRIYSSLPNAPSMVENSATVKADPCSSTASMISRKDRKWRKEAFFSALGKPSKPVDTPAKETTVADEYGRISEDSSSDGD